jgi:Mce-associated membrane protein
VHGQQHRTDFRQSALAAARQFAVDFSTYDYQHADRDLARLKSEATGGLRDQVAAAQKQLLTLLRQGKATARGVVRRSAIYRVVPTGVTVLAVVDQTFSNVAVTQGGGTHRYRFVLDLTHTHGRWLVRNFQFV